MKFDGLYTIRDVSSDWCFDLVFEWEEIITKALQLPVLRKSWLVKQVHRVIFHAPYMGFLRYPFFGFTRKYLRFSMDALDKAEIFNHRTIVPIVIDFFVADDNIQAFIDNFSNCKLVLITSRQAYDNLLKHKLPFKIAHLPITLSDKFKRPMPDYKKKKFELTLFGRQAQDPFFKEKLDRYCQKHPDFVYVKQRDDNRLIYITNKGDVVADASTREGYLDLMENTKIAIYGTPGLSGRPRTNGYDQVTPRFLEFLSCGCQVMLRYPKNSDTDWFELEKFGKSVETYDDFEATLDRLRSSEPDYDFYSEYLAKHYTSTLIPMLQAL